MIIRNYYEKVYANIVEKFEEMDKFLESYNPPRLNEEDIGNLSRPITSNGIEAVIRSLPSKKSPRPDVFTT